MPVAQWMRTGFADPITENEMMESLLLLSDGLDPK